MDCITAVRGPSKKALRIYCTRDSEMHSKYFYAIKFCTQLFISLWKNRMDGS